MTDAFARLLRRLGVALHSAGTATDHRGIRTPYRVGLRESATTAGSRSPTIRQLLTRQALAYKPFSALDDDLDPVLEPIRSFLPPLAAGAWRAAS